MNSWMKRKYSIAAVLILLIAGCVRQPLVVHDEVLIYDKPFDYVYLGIIRSVDNTDHWDVSHTDREKGLINILNHHYGDPFDADKRQITIVVKRITKGKTSVQIAKDSQRVIGAGEIMKEIDFVMGRYRV